MRDIQDKKAFTVIALNTESSEKDQQILDFNGFINYKQVNGVYKGQTELSYVISTPTPETLQNVYNLAKQYSQESILFVDADRNAELVYINTGKRVALGGFKCVNRTEAYQNDAFTHDPSTDYYYLAK